MLFLQAAGLPANLHLILHSRLSGVLYLRVLILMILNWLLELPFHGNTPGTNNLLTDCAENDEFIRFF